MDAFVSRKRRRLPVMDEVPAKASSCLQNEDDSTDIKLALLASLHPSADQDVLLKALVCSRGSVEVASSFVSTESSAIPPRKHAVPGYQSSLSSFARRGSSSDTSSQKSQKKLTRKGATLHLYSPEDIAAHTPCSIVHNFLPPLEADALLHELLDEAPTYRREQFRIFDNVVQSPHTMCFYVDSLHEARSQQTDYIYNGSHLTDVRRTTPEMRKVAGKVKTKVNEEILARIKSHYPEGKRLKFQSPHEWVPNASFVNCYDGGAENVGYHADQLTYLGPRAVIGSLSLGVSREFRVRKVVPRDEADNKLKRLDEARQDAEGQISIHLPHNSLLVMHADMQEEWKHSIAPAQAIDPHPIAGNKRINVTYRYYRPSFHPSLTPRCKCGVGTVLRCSAKSKVNRGRYMWMCHAGLTPEGKAGNGRKGGCGFFEWAVFDDDGAPPWAWKSRDESTEQIAQKDAI